MYQEKFDELWAKTVNSALYGISAKGIKGKTQINAYLHRIVWDHAWGNKEVVTMERKLLHDMSKENPKKAMEMGAILSNITVEYSWKLYAGIAIVLAGILVLITAQGIWKAVGGVAGLVGISLALGDALQSHVDPRKAASNALAKAKKQCDKIVY